MARPFDIDPQQVVVGNVTLIFYNDPLDPSICKLQVAASGSQTNTLVPFVRKGLAVAGGQTTSIPVADSTGPLGSSTQIGANPHNPSHGPGFGV